MGEFKRGWQTKSFVKDVGSPGLMDLENKAEATEFRKEGFFFHVREGKKRTFGF